MNRRSFLKALGVTTAGIAVPGLILPPETEKRFWALDQTMLRHQFRWDNGWHFNPEAQLQLNEAMEQAMRKARMDLDRMLLFGEVETTAGRFVANVYEYRNGE